MSRILTFYRPSRHLTPTSGTHVAELLFTSPEACLDAMLAYANASIAGEIPDDGAGEPLRMPSPWVCGPDIPKGFSGYDIERIDAIAAIIKNRVRITASYRMRWYHERIDTLSTTVDGVACTGKRTVRDLESDWTTEYQPFSWSKEMHPLVGRSSLSMESITYVVGDGLSAAEIVTEARNSRVTQEM